MTFAVSLLIVFLDAYFSGVLCQRPSLLQLISFEQRNLFVNKGSGFQLSCPFIGVDNNQAKIQWFKNDVPISPVPGVAVLSLRNASRFDAGSYYCKVSDDHAAVLSESTRVHVAYFVPPFTETLFHIRCGRGSYAVLNAPHIDASPLDKLQWTWTHNGKRVGQSAKAFLSTTGSLVLLNVQQQDYGPYTLQVRHSVLPESASAKFNYFLEPDDQEDVTSDAKIVWKPKDLAYVKSEWSGPAVFECVVFDQYPERSHIVWKLNDAQIFDNSPEFQFLHGRRTLVIRQPSDRHAGVYACEVSTSFHEGQSAAASLTIQKAPTIVRSLPNVTYATLEGSLDLLCEFHAKPEANITWYFNGDDLTEPLQCCASSLALAVLPGGGLRILKVSQEHVGIYQCRARNDYGSVIDTTELQLRGDQPSITIVQNVTSSVGNNVTLTCQVNGNPEPTISWSFAGKKIEKQEDMMQDGSALRIFGAQRKHSGWYTCTAVNGFGKAEESVYLSVEESTGIVHGPEDQAVIIGSTVRLPCQVSLGSDSSTVTRRWYLKKHLLIPGSVRNIQFMPDGSIVISQVNSINIGPYTCEVDTPFGVMSKTGFLKIVEKPGMPLHVKAFVNNETSPVCVALSWSEGFDGNSPIIKYVLEQRVLNVDGTPSEWETAVDNIGREQTSVNIENLKPSAMYEFRVIAVNRFGYGIPSVPSNLVVMPQQAPAAAPVNVAGSARSASDIMVQWQPPPPEQWNGDILGYIIRYRLANYPDIPWIYRNLSDSRARNWMISDLITWREYEIQMAAYNDRGAGVYSKSMYITTLEGVPSEAPTILSATVLNSTAVHVALKPPPQQMIPGVNLGYKIEAWLGEPGIHRAGLAKVLPYSLNAVQGTLAGLQKYTTYNVTVLCFTAPGDGPRSEPVQLTTRQDLPEKVKGAVVEETFFDSAVLKWEQPEHPNGVLLNYVVSYWSVNDSSVNRTVTVPNNTVSFRLEGLQPLSQYVVLVYAVTEVGSGPPSRLQITTTVPPELPGAPSRLSISNVQQRSVNLQFTPGYDGKTFISRWIVEALVGSSSAWQEVFSVHAPQAKSITVDQLRPFTNYTLRLIAENVVGRSPASAPSSQFQTLQDVPEHSPADFDVQAWSDHTVRVTWNPLSRDAWNGPAGGYVLFVQSANEADFPTRREEIRIDNPKTSELLVPDLCSACTYGVHMVAFNGIGRSNDSEKLAVTTYESEPSAGPGDVNVTVESPTAVLVSWGDVAAAHRNGRLTGYRIEYQSSDPPTHQGHLMVNDELQRSALLEELRPYTKYRLRVAAVNSIGVGAFSRPDVVFRTPAGLSEPPSELYFPYVTTTEVRMTWKPPYRSNGDIQGYVVSYWLNSAGQEGAVKAHLKSDLRLYVASGLFPMTAYTFSVSAVSAAGTGAPAVATVYTSTDRSLPQSPTRPVQASDVPVTSSQVGIAWNSADGGRMPIRFSEVQIQYENSDNWLDWTEKVTGQQAVIGELKANSAYRFRVRSMNDHGHSPWSIESDWIRTLETVPGEPPRDIRVTATNGTSILVEWRAPERSTWHADVVGYRIVYRVYGFGSMANRSDLVQEFPMTDAFKRDWRFELTDLQRFRHYIVRLQTFNHIGSSPMSKPHFVYVAYSTPERPVTGFRAEPISSTEVKVSWDLWDLRASPVNGFKLAFAERNAGLNESAVEEDIVEAEMNHKVLTGLKKYTNYSVEVRPFNRAGDGPPVRTDVRTLPDRPGPVSRLTFQDVLLDSVNVSWGRPAEPNGPIMGYRVTYKTFKLGNEFVSQRQEKVIGREYLLVSNLEENVTVTFLVEAETVVGYGEPVNGTIEVGPQPGSPEAPGRPSLYPSDSSVTLEWTDSANAPNASVTSYVIQYSVEGSAEPAKSGRIRREVLFSDAVLNGRWRTLATVDGSQRSYTIPYKQLKPGVVYHFRVAARNKNGVSYPSLQSDSFVIPNGFSEKPFYLEGWFLVILALVLLVIVVIVVAALWVTGSKTKQEKPRAGSNSSLQLSDGGIVTYQLRSSSKHNKVRKVPFGNNQYSRYPILSNDDFTFTTPPPKERSTSGGWNKEDRSQNWYDSVGHAAPSAAAPLPTQVTQDGRSHQSYYEYQDDGLEAGVDNIAQHYKTSDSCYKETWRRAKQAAHRPNSGSQNSDKECAPNDLSPDMSTSLNRVPRTGFSSFV